MKKSLAISLFIGGIMFAGLTALANDTLTTPSGIKYVTIKEGDGIHPTSKQTVKVIYCQKSSTGKIIESNELSKPLKFHVDNHEVIAGIDEVVKKMSKGEMLYCIIPPELSYGKKGVHGHSAPNTTLYLYLQVVDIQ